MSKAQGDLNGDGAADLAVVIRGKDAKFINKNDSLGVNPFDTNPRILLILFKNKTGYTLVRQSNTFIVIPESPTMDEPLESMTIKKGILQFGFSIWYSAGSWETSQYEYNFRFRNGEFVLIGADKTTSMRNSGEMESRSYNFLTNRVRIMTGNFTSDDEKIRVKTFRLKKLKTLDTLKKPSDWKIEKGYFL